MVVTLDPAAAVGGHLPKRDDISYFVTHPTHPSVFNWEEDKKRHFDYFGGITARQAIVCALMQGPEEHYQIGEALATGCMHQLHARIGLPLNKWHCWNLAWQRLSWVLLCSPCAKPWMKSSKWEFPKMQSSISLWDISTLIWPCALIRYPAACFQMPATKPFKLENPLSLKTTGRKYLDPEHVKYQVGVMTKLPS